MTPYRHVILATGLLALLAGGLSSPLQAESLRIGAEDDWYPYTALKDGKVQGMSVDIVKAAFAATDTQVELVPYPYARCMQMARNGQLVACFNTAPDAQIAADYLLPQNPLFSDDILLWTRNEQAAPISSLEQLAGKKIAVTIGYEYGSRFDSDQQLQRVKVRKDLNGFLMLQHQRVDYFVAYRGTANQLFHDHPALAGQFSPVYTVYQSQLFLSFSRQNPASAELLQRFDQGMQLIHNSGRYQQIIEQWQQNTAH